MVPWIVLSLLLSSVVGFKFEERGDDNFDKSVIKEVDAGDCERRPKVINIYQGETIRITTPGFKADGYVDNLKCFWKFKIPSRTSMQVRCEEVYLVDGDSLTIGRGFFGKKYTNMTGEPLAISLNQNSLKIGIVTDNNNTAQGFTCGIRIGLSNVQCECGKRSPLRRIVGGQRANVGEFPWHVGIVVSGKTTPFCGGTIVNSDFVLTAAQCVHNKVPCLVQLLIGGFDLTDEENNFVDVKKIIVHPDYSSGGYEHNLAIIQMETLDFDTLAESIRPVCLPASATADFVGYSNAIIAGWGPTKLDDDPENKLRYTKVTVISNADCNNSFPNVITNDMICAQGTETGPCQSDDGGGLIVPMSLVVGNYEVIGVATWDSQCDYGTSPGIYHRITATLAWIESKIRSGTRCPRPTA